MRSERRRRMRGLSPRMRTPHPALRATFSHKGRREWASPAMTVAERNYFPAFAPRGCTVTLQPIQMHADMRGLGRGIGERDGAVEGDQRFVVAAELHQEGAAHAEEMEIVRQPRRQRLDHLERRLRRRAPWRPRPRGSRSPPATAASLRARRRAGRSGSSRYLRAWRRGHAAPLSRPGSDTARCGDGASPCRSAPAPRRSSSAFHSVRSWSSSRITAPSLIEPCLGAGMLQQQQRRQPHDLGLALEQPQQQPRQTDRLLAQRFADFGGIAAGRIAFIEDQVDHRGDRGRAVRCAPPHRASRTARWRRRRGLSPG